MPAPDIRTNRLLLRSWTAQDQPAFAALNADPVVMEHFPAPLARVESDALAERIAAGLADNDFGLWAVEVPGVAPFIGFVGLAAPSFEAHFTPCVEIGWRLGRAHWGRGYATGGARACLEYAFGPLDVPEVVSFTTMTNRNSRRVMEKLAMSHDPSDDFDHPLLAADSPQRHQVLYRLTRASWLADRTVATDTLRLAPAQND